MKHLRLLVTVAILHLGIIGLVLLQPGCVRKSPTPADTDIAAEIGPQEPQRAFFAPTRPTEPVAVRSLDPVDDPWNAPLDLPPPKVKSKPPDQPLSEAMPQLAGALYTVQAGDTLSQIARRHEVTVEALRQENGLSDASLIRVGQILLLPEDATLAESPASSQPETPQLPSGAYRVEPGDTLSRLARRFGTTVALLRSSNGLENDIIRVGQLLQVPSGTSPKETLPARRQPVATAPSIEVTASGNYRVQPGDTLSAIGKRFGVNYRDIMAANGITDARQLRAGAELRIPSTEATSPEPTVEPEPQPTAPVLAENPRVSNEPPQRSSSLPPAPPLRRQPAFEQASFEIPLVPVDEAPEESAN